GESQSDVREGSVVEVDRVVPVEEQEAEDGDRHEQVEALILGTAQTLDELGPAPSSSGSYCVLDRVHWVDSSSVIAASTSWPLSCCWTSVMYVSSRVARRT